MELRVQESREFGEFWELQAQDKEPEVALEVLKLLLELDRENPGLREKSGIWDQKFAIWGRKSGIWGWGSGTRGHRIPGIPRNLEEALSDEDCRSVFPIVFVSSRALASAARKFLFQRLLDPQRGAGSGRGFFLRSQVSPRESREQREQKSRLSRSLIPLLPQLLEKFSVVSALLELLQHLELGTLRSARMDKAESPDEDDVYGLAAMLGRLWALFR
ncbi:hypothetical protein DUI87_22410 [Hirundo rustica rustica]|uniref:Cohesin subunit SCC3/SA HEAT-repeats domain-containing protein n=1 Tax=Hirundo rustica rustica TaxID=333673 RepID=A0A3M0JIU1_HIRRU|nr:hypothetical protein DUI87_22410 [Hirundo rustica rustica]